MGNKTKNKYIYPIEINDKVQMSRDKSPVHVGNLKYAIDFIVKEETPVKAAADGIVIDLKLDSDVGGTDKEFEPLGNFIEIEHENDEYSEYEHLQKDKVIVKLGEKVKKGQVIGYSGATGYLAHLGPHLHFMVGKYGKTINDYETLEIIWENR
jgi:murein DD-endopeptidase MepM/ murein hydrolase activator NlpD